MILTDDVNFLELYPKEARQALVPTQKNIIYALNWLLQSQATYLWFYYSGKIPKYRLPAMLVCLHQYTEVRYSKGTYYDKCVFHKSWFPALKSEVFFCMNQEFYRTPSWGGLL